MSHRGSSAVAGFCDHLGWGNLALVLCHDVDIFFVVKQLVVRATH